MNLSAAFYGGIIILSVNMNEIPSKSALIDIDLIIKMAQIKRNNKVADLGCGKTGFFVFPAAKLVGGYGVVYAVDIIKSILDEINNRAKLENFKNIKTVWSDLEIFNAAKIESGSLDVALLINTLHQSKKRVEILRESIRMLKTGARLVIVEWNDSQVPMGPEAGERVDYNLLVKGIQKLGLILEKEFVPGQCHYGLVCTKY